MITIYSVTDTNDKVPYASLSLFSCEQFANGTPDYKITSEEFETSELTDELIRSFWRNPGAMVAILKILRRYPEKEVQMLKTLRDDIARLEAENYKLESRLQEDCDMWFVVDRLDNPIYCSDTAEECYRWALRALQPQSLTILKASVRFYGDENN